VNTVEEDEAQPRVVADVLHLYEEVSDLRQDVADLRLQIANMVRVWHWVGVGGYFVFSIWVMWTLGWLIAF
jgi:hypothetical protein